MTFSPDKFKLSVLFVVVVLFLLPCVRLTLHVKQRGPFCSMVAEQSELQPLLGNLGSVFLEVACDTN